MLLRAYSGNKIMTFINFVNLLVNVPKSIQIDFSGFSEAFLNPESCEMMKYSVNNGYRTVLYTTLTGFTEDYARVLEGVKFNDVVFHLYPGYNAEAFEYKKNLFEKYICPANRTANLVPDQGAVNTMYLSRAGNVNEKDIMRGKFECFWVGKEFNHNVVLPNGDVYLCCMDYGLKHKLGNLFTTKYENLDRQTIIDLSDMEDSDIICRKCEMFKKI